MMNYFYPGSFFIIKHSGVLIAIDKDIYPMGLKISQVVQNECLPNE